MFLHWSKKLGSVPTYAKDKDDHKEFIDCTTSGMLSILPFFLKSVELAVAPPGDFLPIWWLLVLVSKQGFFARRSH